MGVHLLGLCARALCVPQAAPGWWGSLLTPRARLQCWGLRAQGCANLLFTAFSSFPPPSLRIVNNTLPKISVRSLPGFGHQVDFNTQLLVESRYSTSIRGMAWGGGSASLWKADGQQMS